jgi:prepilin-type N-terminal cleavage/methylation domain-containing protein
MRKLIRRPEGFTLIELMIVILIIAILVAIAVPVYLNARTNAQRRTCQSNIRTVDSAIQAYESTMWDSSQPTQMSDMLSVTCKTLKSAPVCPAANGTAYIWISGTPPEISCPATGVTGHKI